MPVIAVLGAGAMGAAIGSHVARRQPGTVLLATQWDGAVVDAWRAGEPHPALGLRLHDKIECRPHDEWDDVLPDADLIIVALASTGLKEALEDVVPRARPDAAWAIVTKGWQEHTLESPSRIIGSLVGSDDRVVAVAGPGLAPEIAVGLPTALVCAGRDPELTRQVARVLRGRSLTTVTTDDVIGAETCSAYKNVVAIAVGMCEGFTQRMPERAYVSQFANARAVVFAQGLVDMVRLSQALGGRAETVLGLAGSGDLYVTCTGGRNGRFGRMLGAGQTPEQALNAIGSTVEGVPNCRAALELGAKLSVELPTARIVEGALKNEFSDQAGAAQLTRAFATALAGGANVLGV
jgi:glycerol-3-phosphate dehydrogenase (NAD(P)+)